MKPPTSTDRPYPRIITEAKCEAHTKVPQCLFCGSYHEVHGHRGVGCCRRGSDGLQRLRGVWWGRESGSR